jgi:hypothetical protein
VPIVPPVALAPAVPGPAPPAGLPATAPAPAVPGAPALVAGGSSEPLHAMPVAAIANNTLNAAGFRNGVNFRRGRTDLELRALLVIVGQWRIMPYSAASGRRHANNGKVR